jgi:hypothetical protein
LEAGLTRAQAVEETLEWLELLAAASRRRRARDQLDLAHAFAAAQAEKGDWKTWQKQKIKETRISDE